MGYMYPACQVAARLSAPVAERHGPRDISIPVTADHRHRLATHIKRILGRRGLSARAAEAEAGLPRRSIYSVIEGHSPSLDRAAEICSALGLEFYVGPPREASRSESQPPETQIPPLTAFSPRVEMPVRGWARCSLEGVLSGVKDYRDAPAPEKLTDPEAFYALASGVSMRPEGIETGDYCLVSPRTELEAGQRVWLKDRQGQEAIKRLVKIDKASYHLRGWLPAEGGPQKPYDDQWRRSNVAESGVVLAVYRGSPSAKDPPPFIPDPRAAPAPTPVAEPPPAMLPPDLERAAQSMVRAVAAAGGDPIPPDLRAKLLGPNHARAGRHAPRPERAVVSFALPRLAAGSGEMVFDEVDEMRGIELGPGALASWAQPERVTCFRVAGDSMLPTIRDGDLAAIDRGRIEPLEGQLFGVRTDEGLMVKRLRHIEGRWCLTSDNASYPPRPAEEEDRILGQVAWVGPPGE